MQEIKRKDFKEIYGIDLPIGKYNIEDMGDYYNIYIISSETQGCILPVTSLDIKTNVYGINSKIAFDEIMKYKTNLKSIIILDNL